MPWVKRENIKVPVVKNIIYAFKTLYKANKTYMFWQIMNLLVYSLFINFFQTVLFLKILLNIID